MTGQPLIDAKPCPFCDCEDIVIKIRKTAIVECTGCGALIISVDARVAIQKWNTRVEPECCIYAQQTMGVKC